MAKEKTDPTPMAVRVQRHGIDVMREQIVGDAAITITPVVGDKRGKVTTFLAADADELLVELRGAWEPQPATDADELERRERVARGDEPEISEPAPRAKRSPAKRKTSAKSKTKAAAKRKTSK